jgi:hypothetical protein
MVRIIPKYRRARRHLARYQQRAISLLCTVRSQKGVASGMATAPAMVI